MSDQDSVVDAENSGYNSSINRKKNHDSSCCPFVQSDFLYTSWMIGWIKGTRVWIEEKTTRS